jgi:CubicO group peptidase (beta-lactamase class C family)
MSINRYYKERIFQPAGLTRTFYDLSNGVVSVMKPSIRVTL